LSKRVFVETSTGHFEAREVETGWHMNDRVQIVKGLRPGESVVAAGTFLVDSESRLQTVSNSGLTTGEAPGAKTAMVHSMN
jgi:Cu(I)/Ag(I) efflux system membrane fusion protein